MPELKPQILPSGIFHQLLSTSMAIPPNPFPTAPGTNLEGLHVGTSAVHPPCPAHFVFSFFGSRSKRDTVATKETYQASLRGRRDSVTEAPVLLQRPVL